MSKKTNQGFTLIELLVVVAVIALLGSIILASLSGARSKARDTKRVAEARSIEKALFAYANNHSGYVPDSAFHTIAQADAADGATDGVVNCTGPNKTNNDQLFAALIADKVLPSAPSEDPMAGKGYCYVYITDIGVSGIGFNDHNNIIAGIAYDQFGNEIEIVGEPILLAATTVTKSRNAIFGALSENTKTLTNANAFVGVSYGGGVISGAQLNVDLTTGLRYNTAVLNEGSN